LQILRFNFDFNTLILSTDIVGDFIIARKLLRRRHIQKERREKREAEEEELNRERHLKKAKYHEKHHQAKSSISHVLSRSITSNESFSDSESSDNYP